MQTRDSSPLNAAFHALVARRLSEDTRTRFLGFGVSRHGLKATGRVLDMPISEETILGIAFGMSRVGAETFVDLMFESFAARAWDVLWNQAALSAAMPASAAPVTVRMLSGLLASAGPQHGCSGYGLLARLPYVLVAAPVAANQVETAYQASRNRKRPLLLLTPDSIFESDPASLGCAIQQVARVGHGTELAVIAFGAHAALVAEAVTSVEAWRRVSILVPLFLNPLPVNELLGLASGARRCIIAEGPAPATIGDQIGWQAATRGLLCESWPLWDAAPEAPFDRVEAVRRFGSRIMEVKS